MGESSNAQGKVVRFDSFNSKLEGIAEVSEEGEIIRSQELQEWLRRSLE